VREKKEGRGENCISAEGKVRSEVPETPWQVTTTEHEDGGVDRSSVGISHHDFGGDVGSVLSLSEKWEGRM